MPILLSLTGLPSAGLAAGQALSYGTVTPELTTVAGPAEAIGLYGIAALFSSKSFHTDQFSCGKSVDWSESVQHPLGVRGQNMK